MKYTKSSAWLTRPPTAGRAHAEQPSPHGPVGAQAGRPRGGAHRRDEDEQRGADCPRRKTAVLGCKSAPRPHPKNRRTEPIRSGEREGRGGAAAGPGQMPSVPRRCSAGAKQAKLTSSSAPIEPEGDIHRG